MTNRALNCDQILLRPLHWVIPPWFLSRFLALFQILGISPQGVQHWPFDKWSTHHFPWDICVSERNFDLWREGWRPVTAAEGVKVMAFKILEGWRTHGGIYEMKNIIFNMVFCYCSKINKNTYHSAGLFRIKRYESFQILPSLHFCYSSSSKVRDIST